MMRRNDEYDQDNMVWIKTDQHDGAFQAGIEKQVRAARISVRGALAYE